MPAEDRGASYPGDVRPFVVFLPGVINPAKISYGPLLGVIGDEVRAAVKELEVYAEETTPPPDYGLDTEVEGIERLADEAGQESVHLVGYSAGASYALAFAAKYPERASSLALIEPAWIGNEGWTPEETAYWAEADVIMALPPAERMGRFLRMLLRPGVQPPPRPPGPPPPWMANRPAGLEAVHRSFRSSGLDFESLREFRKPVYLALGSLTNPIKIEREAQRMISMLPNVEVEVYEGRHHLDSPHMAEPERFARALRKLWRQTAS